MAGLRSNGLFSFTILVTPSHAQEVPYSPDLPHLFFGEELYHLARMWTRGWDVFAPVCPLVFHQWDRTARTKATSLRDSAAAGSNVAAQVMAAKITTNDTSAPQEGVAAISDLAVDGVAGSVSTESNPSSGSQRDNDIVATAAPLDTACSSVSFSVCTSVEGAATTSTTNSTDPSASELATLSRSRILSLFRSPLSVGASSKGTSSAASRAINDQHGTEGLSDVATTAVNAARSDIEHIDLQLECEKGEYIRLAGWGVGEVWGLGCERSLADFQESTGLHFGNKLMDIQAVWGGFAPGDFLH